MKRTLFLSLLFLLPSVQAAERKWLRRAHVIAACAASAADAYSTLRLNPYARMGLVREANPLLAGRGGAVSPLRLVSFKALQCGASLIADRYVKSDTISIGASLTQIAAFSYVTASNLDHLSRLKRTVPATGVSSPALATTAPRFEIAVPR